MINIYEPMLNDKYALDAIKSNWVSSNGKYLGMVEEELLKLTKNKKVILTNNGTSATHLIAIGLKYKYPSIENIIVPNNVYVAAWNSFIMNPVFNLIPIDSNINTWNMDIVKLKEELNRNDYKKTAVLIVHNVGNIINVPNLKKEFPNYVFIEDNCEGMFGEYNNIPSGSSLMSSVSFYGNKTITSGEGGAIFINDDDVYEYLNSVRSQGHTNKKFIFDKLGYNYRMTNIEAAILYGQIEILEKIIENKKRVFNLYKNNIEGVNFQEIEKDTKHSMWMFGIRFDNDLDINKISLNLYRNNIDTRPMFPPMSYHNHLKGFISDETISDKLYKTALILPSHPNLTNNEILFICKHINDILYKNKKK